MSTNQYKSKIKKVLQEKNSAHTLESIVLEMSEKGFQKQIIYDLFHEIYREENDDSKIDPLLDILDRLVGWCHKQAILLPDEEVKQG